MAAGATVTITLVVTVVSGDSAVSVVDVTTGSHDPDWDNNHSVGTVTAGPAADVQLEKSASPTTAAPGDPVSFTLTVTNAGPTTASGVELSDTLPAGLLNAEVGPFADCELNGSDVTCSRSSLASGQSFTATVTATVEPSFAGTELVNSAAVISTTIDSDLSNNTATAVVAIEASTADLSVIKTVDPEPAIAGELIRYTLQVRNAGPADATDATLSDELPSVLTGIAVASDLGSCTVAGNSLDCDFGTLPAGAVVTVEVEAELTPSATGEVVNTVTVASTTDDPDLANNTSTVTSTVGNSADLAITKTGSPAEAGSGDQVVYTLVVTNHGPSDAPGTVVTDELPDDLGYEPGSCSTEQGTCEAEDGVVTFDLGTVAAGDSVELEFTATVGPDAGDGVLTNVARVSHDGEDPDPENNEAGHDLNVDAAADVSVTKTAGPSPIVAGETITFTVVATNTGPGTATDLVLTDLVPGTVTLTALTASAGACDSGLANSVHCTLGSLDPGEDWTITITGTLDPAAGRGTLRNSATVTVPDDPTSSNNTAQVAVPVVTRADLTLTKAGPLTVVAGEELTYTVTLANAGPSVARSTVVVDSLPAGTSFADGGGDGVTCAAQEDAPTLVRCPIGDLAPGASSSLSLTVLVDPAAADGTTLTNQVLAATITPGLSDGRLAVANTLVVASADLETIKSVLPGVLVAGGQATYRIQVHNDGPSAAVDVRVEDAIPDGLTVRAVAPGGGECTVADGDLTCERDALSAGATWTIVVQVDVGPSVVGPVSNTAEAVAATTDPEPTDNTGTAIADVVVAADVAMVKTALFGELQPGQSAIFFLSAVGNGPSAATDVTVTDTFPAGLTPTEVVGEGCAIAGQQVTCSYATLGRGEVRTAVVFAAVADDAEGELTNTATVSAATPDPDPTNNQAAATVEVSADAPGPPGGGEDLASTGAGSGLGWLAGAGLAALLGGALLLVLRKRGRSAAAAD